MATYFAIVQIPGTRLFKQPIHIYSQPQETVGNVVIKAERSRVINPDADGIYRVEDVDWKKKQVQAAFALAQERHNHPGHPPRLLGPFMDDDPKTVKNPETGYRKAQIAAVTSRPKTAEEKVAILESENEKLKLELTAVRKPHKE